jgi:hypothetical protein
MSKKKESKDKPTTTTGDRATWNDNEVEALLDHLAGKSAMGADSDNSTYKSPNFTSAATDIASMRTLGPVKTAKMCHSKFGAVSTASRFNEAPADPLSISSNRHIMLSRITKPNLEFHGMMKKVRISRQKPSKRRGRNSFL